MNGWNIIGSERVLHGLPGSESKYKTRNSLLTPQHQTKTTPSQPQLLSINAQSEYHHHQNLRRDTLIRFNTAIFPLKLQSSLRFSRTEGKITISTQLHSSRFPSFKTRARCRPLFNSKKNTRLPREGRYNPRHASLTIHLARSPHKLRWMVLRIGWRIPRKT